MNIEQIKKTLYLLLAGSFVVGGGLSYNKLNLFHVLGLIFLPFLVQKVLLELRKPDSLGFGSFFAAGTLIWYALSLFWVKDIVFGAKYIFYLLNGFFIVFCFFYFTDNKKDLKTLLLVLGGVCFLNLLIGFGESFFGIRWFISRLSTYNSFFNLDTKFEVYRALLEKDMVLRPDVYHFLKTQPSGFNWGPNKYGLFLSTLFPFLILNLNRAKSFVASLLLLTLVYMVSSRAVIAGVVVMSGLLMFTPSKIGLYKRGLSALALVLIMSIPLLSFTKFGLGHNMSRTTKVLSIYYLVNQSLAKVNLDISWIDSFHRSFEGFGPFEPAKDFRDDSSAGKRAQLFKSAWKEYKKRPILGLGAGNSAQKLKGFLFGKTQIHSFWAELLFEGGAVYFFFLLLWSLFQLRSLLRVALQSEGFVSYTAMACLISMIGFIPSSFAVGTAIYQPILWVLIGLSAAVVKVHKKSVMGAAVTGQ